MPKNGQSGKFKPKSHSKKGLSGRKFSPVRKIHQNERAGIRTQNQWLKRTESELRFLRPRACHFTLVHWTQSKESLLDAYFKGRVNINLSNGFSYQKPVFTSLLFLPNNCTIVFWFIEDKGENIEIVSLLPGCEGHGIIKKGQLSSQSR
jgi:hypothetical protein